MCPLISSSHCVSLPQEVFKRDGKKQQVLDEIKQVASSDRGFKNYRERLRSINPPCVPFLGMIIN